MKKTCIVFVINVFVLFFLLPLAVFASEKKDSWDIRAEIIRSLKSVRCTDFGHVKKESLEKYFSYIFSYEIGRKKWIRGIYNSLDKREQKTFVAQYESVATSNIGSYLIIGNVYDNRYGIVYKIYSDGAIECLTTAIAPGS